MDFERFSGKRILLAESDSISYYMKADGKSEFNVDFVLDWEPFEKPGLAQFMLDNNILAGVIHAALFNETTLLQAHKDGAKLLILYSEAVDIERNQMFHRLLSNGLNLMGRPSEFSPKVILEGVGNVLDWKTK